MSSKMNQLHGLMSLKRSKKCNRWLGFWKVQEGVGQHYVLTQREMVNKEEFFIPKYVVYGFDGSTCDSTLLKTIINIEGRLATRLQWIFQLQNTRQSSNVLKKNNTSHRRAAECIKAYIRSNNNKATSQWNQDCKYIIRTTRLPIVKKMRTKHQTLATLFKTGTIVSFFASLVA
jgi:hypothetical protein